MDEDSIVRVHGIFTRIGLYKIVLLEFIESLQKKIMHLPELNIRSTQT